MAALRATTGDPLQQGVWSSSPPYTTRQNDHQHVNGSQQSWNSCRNVMPVMDSWVFEYELSRDRLTTRPPSLPSPQMELAQVTSTCDGPSSSSGSSSSARGGRSVVSAGDRTKSRGNFKITLPHFISRDKDKTPKNNKPQSSSETSDHAPDKMKTKLLSVWNNMKYGWTVKLKTNFSRDSAIWLLGKCYHQKPEFFANPISTTELAQVFQEFQQDFYTRIWLTYRREFQVLAGSSLTTDCGWGCMLRSGQMLLAEGLVYHFLGREWRCMSEQTGNQDEMHRQIIRWFGDIPDDSSPFALHQLVTIGKSMGKKAGDWYGPASVAHILKHAMEKAKTLDARLSNLCVYVAQDCTVYMQDVMDLCLRNVEDGDDHSQTWQGVIIFVPVRLGGETFNPVYVHCLQLFLSDCNCIGIIGGRPKHSLHFVGWQDDKLIHLDPHYCQEVVDVSKRDFPLQSFHCLSPRKMSFSRMDPSCTIGFYCATRDQFDKFVTLSQQVVLRHSVYGEYPIFVVSDGRSNDCNVGQHWSPQDDTLFMVNDYRPDADLGSEDDSEEFVVL